MTVTLTTHGYTYSAVLDEETVDIACDGIWVGTGTWEEGEICCDALLGSSYEASEKVYAALSRKLDVKLEEAR